MSKSLNVSGMQIILWKFNTLKQHSNFILFSQTTAKMAKPKTPSKSSETAANKPAETQTSADTTESKPAAQTTSKVTEPEKKTLSSADIQTKATSSKPAPEKVETSSASISTDTDEAARPVSTRSRVAESKVPTQPEKNQETREVYSRHSLWF